MDDILRFGSHGSPVRELQGLLNNNLPAGARLAVDGDFGPRTKSAVTRFQADKWLVADGEVGPCTWAALRGTEKYTILHTVRLVPQWTDATCWSASTAMILGRQACMSSGPADATATDGIYNDSDLDDPVNMRKFADYYHLHMLPGQSWTPDGLANLLRSGPIMINTLWDVAGYVKRQGSSGHMRVIAGIRGDGTSEGTTIRVYDPWPPSKGAIYSKIYGPFMQDTPAATYQIFYR